MEGLYRKSTKRWLAAVLWNWALVGVGISFALRFGTWWSYLLALPIVGCAQHGFAILLHEASHSLVGRSRLANEVLPRLLVSWPLMLTLSSYRRFHIEHHQKAGTPEDPENAHKVLFKQWPLPLRTPQVIWACLLNFFVLGPLHLTSILWIARPRTLKHGVDFAMTVGTFVMVAGALMIGGHADIAILWTASLSTFFWLFFYLRTWLEHSGPDVTSRYTPSWLLAHTVCPHNVSFHWEHHKNPKIPFYNLPTARLQMEGPKVYTLAELNQRYRIVAVPSIDQLSMVDSDSIQIKRAS